MMELRSIQRQDGHQGKTTEEVGLRQQQRHLREIRYENNQIQFQDEKVLTFLVTNYNQLQLHWWKNNKMNLVDQHNFQDSKD